LQSLSGKHALTRIFVVGYPQAGKSSLIEALKQEGLFYSIFVRSALLSEADVPPHTAGIVPSVFTSSQYGRVVFYDFAGLLTSTGIVIGVTCGRAVSTG